jgi:hypothetical protein
MPFSRGLSCGQDPCQGPSGGVFRAQNLHFSPTRFHEDPNNSGFPRMQRLGYRVKALGGKPRLLEISWHGIGEWRE